jgi:NADH-quinone oxidoreductase subunit G
MSEDLVNIEVDGKALKARKGAMLMEVTDDADIYIPRFCYHKKLSIAANCRMCLVEVEKAPKPLPACATPVTEGMKVFTASPLAKEAQKGTMEFLLINHPLDCPICDQGGECELQDLAMGYGRDISRYSEKKRVVKDKNIGPLIQTDMTRCIHCTRCVRFGDEVAGLRELGATGRGEFMEIGTYIEKSVASEMSGNVIDLCPVGALTSKPYRYSARAWELRQFDGIAPHDCVGSNIYIHAKGSKVKRVVPRENEAVNETWISDRDRYSYEGIYSEDRLLNPMIKRDGLWRETDWDTALEAAAKAFQEVVSAHGAEQLGFLATPSSTVEEFFLLQGIARGLGSNNIDHRLRQSDFREQENFPVYPSLGMPIAELETLDSVLLVGSYPRHQQPLINHRLRNAWKRGATVSLLNPLDREFNFSIADKIIIEAAQMLGSLAGIAKALTENDIAITATGLEAILQKAEVSDLHRAVAERLRSAKRAAILLGSWATSHPDFSSLYGLASAIARALNLRLGILTDGSNSAGAWLAGAIPHRGPGGAPLDSPGLNLAQMFAQGLRGYVLLGLEPERDLIAVERPLEALSRAACTVALTAYRTPAMNEYADVLLPIALFPENSGSYVNCEGRWQSVKAAVNPVGQAREAWKILRVLGNKLKLNGFDYASAEDVGKAAQQEIGNTNPDMPVAMGVHGSQANGQDAQSLDVSIYDIDPIVRRAAALQKASVAGAA